MRLSFACFLTALLGLAIGLLINLRVVGDAFGRSTAPAAYSGTIQENGAQDAQPGLFDGLLEEEDVKSDSSALGFDQKHLLRQSYAVLTALKNQDFEAFADLVHPEDGVTFTPYSTVDFYSDRTFKPNELSLAEGNSTLYVWGLRDGSGAPIQLSIVDYVQRYVYHADYESAPLIGVNTVLSSGNAYENVSDAYPDDYFVEFYFPELNPENQGFDWCGLKLVFRPVEQRYLLVGIIHSERTN